MLGLTTLGLKLLRSKGYKVVLSDKDGGFVIEHREDYASILDETLGTDIYRSCESMPLIGMRKEAYEALAKKVEKVEKEKGLATCICRSLRFFTNFYSTLKRDVQVTQTARASFTSRDTQHPRLDLPRHVHLAFPSAENLS